MRLTKKSSWLLLLTALVALSLTDCSDDDAGCKPGAPCPCQRANGCIYNCPEADCRPVCNDLDFCDATCGGDCDYTCSRVSECDVDCGAGCQTACTDVSNCRAEVGPQSTVICERLSNCDVKCNGPCRVTCTSVSACNVQCSEGGVTECSDGTRVCGQAC